MSSIVVGMASTAPAYSLAATLGLIVASGGALLAGVKAPAIVLLAFIPMYMIAVAYQELNKAEPDCGTTFTWASRAFGPLVGWMGGWGIIAADVIVMANLAQIAGSYSFTFVGELGWTSAAELASSTLWSTVAGVIWIVVMTYICYRGIEVSARIQYGLLGIELVVLVVFSVVALFKVYTGTAESYSLHAVAVVVLAGRTGLRHRHRPCHPHRDLHLLGLGHRGGLQRGVRRPRHAPRVAPPSSRPFLLLATYALVSVAAIAFAGVGTEGIGLGNPENASGRVRRDRARPVRRQRARARSALLLLSASILTSASASTQTTILPTARTTLSMGVVQGAARSRSPRSTARS